MFGSAGPYRSLGAQSEGAPQLLGARKDQPEPRAGLEADSALQGQAAQALRPRPARGLGEAVWLLLRWEDLVPRRVKLRGNRGHITSGTHSRDRES